MQITTEIIFEVHTDTYKAEAPDSFGKDAVAFGFNAMPTEVAVRLGSKAFLTINLASNGNITVSRFPRQGGDPKIDVLRPS